MAALIEGRTQCIRSVTIHRGPCWPWQHRRMQ